MAGVIMVFGEGNTAGTLERLSTALEHLEGTRVALEEGRLLFRGPNRNPWKLLWCVSSGEIRASSASGAVSVRFVLSYAEFLWEALALGALAFAAVWCSTRFAGAPLSLVELLQASGVIAGCVGVLYGGNVMFSYVRFRRWILQRLFE